MSSIVVLGSGGFLGQALLSNMILSKPIKAVVRRKPSNINLYKKEVTWIEADLMNSSALFDVLSKDDVVINLAYVPDKDNHKKKNITLLSNIIEACLHCKVSRLVHCSTAAVVGNTNVNYINELTQCNPSTIYEKTKLKLEEFLLSKLSRNLDICILRPTAIVGYEGKNLLKLANSLLYGNKVINYLKTCVLGSMPMHLVPARNVVSALLKLALSEKKLNGNIFIISSDQDKDNNFRKVEEILLNELGIKKVLIPHLFLPRMIQSILFKIINRNDINMDRFFDTRKINDFGYVQVDSVKEAIQQFSLSIKVKNSLNSANKKVFD